MVCSQINLRKIEASLIIYIFVIAFLLGMADTKVTKADLDVCIYVAYLYIKGKWYGRDPEVLYLQLTNFQSLIGVMIYCIGFGGDPKTLN